jgi:hypothetical protein
MANPRLQSNLSYAGRRARIHGPLRVDEQAIALDSDLSTEMGITAEELDAIAQLLGNDPETFLSES